jgi:hypothetical protein
MRIYLNILHYFSAFLGLLYVVNCNTDVEESQSTQKFKVDGKVAVPFTGDQDWIQATRILLDGGDYVGFLRSDGSFTINNVPSGTYVVEIACPSFGFEPARVDINSKGKIRARRLNNLQPSAVNTITYPLKFKARGKIGYFQQREQWRITDLLMNPMVLMMILPFLMIMVLPKLINTQDPETQKEMQSQMNMLNPKQNLPEISEILTSWFGSGQTKKAVKPKPSKRR